MKLTGTKSREDFMEIYRRLSKQGIILNDLLLFSGFKLEEMIKEDHYMLGQRFEAGSKISISDVIEVLGDERCLEIGSAIVLIDRLVASINTNVYKNLREVADRINNKIEEHIEKEDIE